jgi:pilus assembly protein CpaB
MGKLRPFLVFGAAVVIALIATVLIYGSIQKSARGGKQAVVETQPIAVAAVDLQWGTVIIKEMVKMEPFLKDTLPAGSVADGPSLVGRVVISPIRAKEPLLESRLAPQNLKTGGVAAVISPKKRAVAVKVDKIIGVAGFIYPGNRVDVLVTMAKIKKEDPVTKIVLENVLVLAAGPDVQIGKGKEEKAAPVDVITLEVTPEESEKLALASTEGKLQLALRGFTDTEEVLTKGTSIPILLASYSGSRPADKPSGKKKAVLVARKAAPSANNAYIIELIQGGKVSTLKFGEGN